MLRLFINASSLKAYKSGEDIICNKKKVTEFNLFNTGNFKCNRKNANKP